ncbi:hypothetical protein J7J84_07950 [bacterium]|nr:hypothetical protein [bacterium]
MKNCTLYLLPLLVVFALSSAVLAGETFTIIIENQRDGRILVQRGADATEVGHVLVPCNAVNHNGFTASAWAADGTVCATAVNAIHIKVGNSTETGRGIVFSLQPAEFLDFDPADYGSYYSESASVFTDIPAGTGIFGGPFAPLVGSPLSVLEESATDELAQATEVSPEYVPQAGDTLLIAVSRSPAADYIEFDNGFGGLISLKRAGEEPEVIGQVLKPVAGVGRFGGSIYAGVGRIRANHPGVVCVSTSPIGEIGGFQIIPSHHAMSPEMTFARTLTQWMVVGPLDAREPGWEGAAPLFFGNLYPSYLPLVSDTPELKSISALNRLLGRFHVLGRMRGSDEWTALPTVTGRADDALVDLAAIRIYFPMPVGAN